MKYVKFLAALLSVCAIASNRAFADDTVESTEARFSYDYYKTSDDDERSPSDIPLPSVGQSDDKGSKGCDSKGCDSKGCGDKSGCDCSCYLFGPDEAIKLFPADDCRRTEIGGWFQLGYHTEGANGDGTGMFNNYPNRFQAQQMWMYAERAVDTGGCGWDWGYRGDIVYGTDGPNTQAFGNAGSEWDNGMDHGGAYGWAIPQAYVEVGYNDVKVKAGHFYTIIGYEVVQATGNFFYSHARTMNLNEPFTHTGVLAEWAYSDNLTLYGGWVQGWDTGFNDNGGSAFLGGLSYQINDCMSITWALIAGDFGFEAQGGSDNNAYMNSIVFDWNITDRLEYVFQNDFQDNQSAIGGTGQNWAINQYLFYTLNDCWAVGARAEYFNQGGFESGEVTLGVNYRPHANIVIRPEVRFDMYESGFGRRDTTLFGIDAVISW